MKHWLLASCLCCLAGCATVETKSKGSLGEPWSGVHLAYSRLDHGGPWHAWPILVVVADVPLSALADTLILPVDLLCRDDTPDYGDLASAP